ncbi:hypothetical protein RFM41_07940 [Mesorhizobium sp. VK25A]|uniref:FAD-dependent oxidoreductase 2 FAD binding domain-containing protein n=1 Tax=Mesorhizobium vachelliae TaxID=3072309 RepID=A0ABU5A3W6_9HYPH|nr:MULTISPECIES: hypothetical protein [unclassified Mesorhizobium]MDX8531892.1 hypothetical protein [Mesorhizobium sp. VK25D]MDX8543665.1 hypothetical protein [Mesorhizobium sp. VK25A]
MDDADVVILGAGSAGCSGKAARAAGFCRLFSVLRRRLEGKSSSSSRREMPLGTWNSQACSRPFDRDAEKPWNNS